MPLHAALIAHELLHGIVVGDQVIRLALLLEKRLVHVAGIRVKITQLYQIKLRGQHKIFYVLKFTIGPVRAKSECIILTDFGVKVSLIFDAFLHFFQGSDVRLIEFLQEALTILLLELDNVLYLFFFQLYFLFIG